MTDEFARLLRGVKIVPLEESPCEDIMHRAAQYYAEPIKDLKLKASLEKLYAVADTDEPIGQWVSNVPRPGDVAGCLNVKQKKTRGVLL